MKFDLPRIIPVLLAGVQCVFAIIRTEQLLSDGTVHITFSNFTNTEAIGQSCSVPKGEALRISYSIGGGGGMDLSKLLQLSSQFNGGYDWSGWVTTYVQHDINWRGPADNRLWLKQWFAVTEAYCRACYGSSPGAPGYSCGSWGSNKGWMPCKDGSFYEYSVSSAYGRCDSGNHCQLGP
ncbi:hypothetical protein BM221_006508 [Beauveria bassiana]|uniref:Uncharacterized protein n=1 Tax=Beauveria bassiana TaxID=176275 RepID=A0A2N6NHW2_BEABA|nr:hypothetical protein BM221_006508 [Beauveria bassiana]